MEMKAQWEARSSELSGRLQCFKSRSQCEHTATPAFVLGRDSPALRER